MCAMTINNANGYGVYNLGFGLNGSNGSQGRGVESLSKRELREQIDKILADVPKGDDGKLTFKDVTDYRDKLRAEFEAAAKADLDALGVDTERDFTLSYDANRDKVTVDAKHPDKKLIDNYFEQNPEMREKFAKIVSLSKLTSTAEQKLSPGQFKQQLQAQALSWWAESNGDASWFSGGGMMMGAGGMQYLQGINRQI